MADVFISYNRMDRAIAERLAAGIRAAGLSPWIDREIKAGEKWRVVVQRELAAMRCMVVIWTPNSVASEHVIEEAAEGKAAGCLIPVKVGECQLPYGFKEIQAASLSSENDPICDEVFSHIADRVKELVAILRGREGIPADALASTATAPVRVPANLAIKPTQRRDWLIASAGVSALGVGGLAAWISRSDVGPKAPSVADSSNLGQRVPTERGRPLGNGEQLRIAFTSAAHTPLFPTGDIWRDILGAKPDLLVLLGNAMFLDVAPLPEQQHPRDMIDAEFHAHAHNQWSALLTSADFRVLAQATPTELVLGEHDYLCQGHAAENATRAPMHAHKVASARALFQRVRTSFSERLQNGGLPAAATDAALWAQDFPPPGYRYRMLNANTVLHLPDYQTVHSGRSLLGSAQRDAIQVAVKQVPEAVHLLASLHRIKSDASPAWADFDDIDWLRKLALEHRIVTLSGAEHANSFHTDGRDRLMNANASGAAVNKLTTVGSRCRNYGLLDINSNGLKFSFYSFGTPDSVGSWRIDRSGWNVVQSG